MLHFVWFYKGSVPTGNRYPIPTARRIAGRRGHAALGGRHSGVRQQHRRRRLARCTPPRRFRKCPGRWHSGRECGTEAGQRLREREAGVDCVVCPQGKTDAGALRRLFCISSTHRSRADVASPGIACRLSLPEWGKLAAPSLVPWVSERSFHGVGEHSRQEQCPVHAVRLQKMLM